MFWGRFLRLEVPGIQAEPCRAADLKASEATTDPHTAPPRWPTSTDADRPGGTKDGMCDGG